MKRVEPLSESYYYILLCLAKGANHGYGIMQLTEKLSGGDVTIGSGTMYGATILRMLSKNPVFFIIPLLPKYFSSR